jgi:hypothetical protein
VTADPSSGTIPTEYLVVNVGTGDVKRHVGGYVWEILIGSNASSRIAFYGVTPVAQPSGADQAGVTLGNVDGEIGGLTISDPPNLADAQTLRDRAKNRRPPPALDAGARGAGGALFAVGVLGWGGNCDLALSLDYLLTGPVSLEDSPQ